MKIIMSVLYVIGWFLDNILFNVILFILYPLIFSTCWSVGYFSLKDREFKNWNKNMNFPRDFYGGDGFGPASTFVASLVFIGLIFLFIWRPIILICVISGIIILAVSITSFCVYKEKENKAIDELIDSDDN